jgi:hypothetical protein
MAQLGCSVDLGCGVAHTVTRRLAVRQARLRISARQCGTPEEALYRAKAMRTTRGYSTSTVVYMMYACTINVKIILKRVAACHQTFFKGAQA